MRTSRPLGGWRQTRRTCGISIISRVEPRAFAIRRRCSRILPPLVVVAARVREGVAGGGLARPRPRSRVKAPRAHAWCPRWASIRVRWFGAYRCSCLGARIARSCFGLAVFAWSFHVHQFCRARKAERRRSPRSLALSSASVSSHGSGFLQSAPLASSFPCGSSLASSVRGGCVELVCSWPSSSCPR